MKFNHIGFVVESIERYEKGLFFEEKIHEVIDPIQKAKISLYTNYESSFIELIEPMNDSSFTWNALQKKGNHFHHICYEVESVDELIHLQKHKRWIEILKPVPALLFNNKQVTFFMDRNKQILEFLIRE